MDLEPDAVPEAVPELIAVPGGLDRGPRDAVDVAAGGTGPHILDGGELRIEHELVYVDAPRRSTAPVAIVRVQSEQ